MGFVVEAASEIDAPAARVWEILRDIERYPEWNPFTVHIDSTLRVGDAVRMQVCLRSKRPVLQVEWVTEHDPGRCLAWSMRESTRWLLGAERRQTLEPLAGERCRYVTRDEVCGLLSPLVRWLYGPAMQRGFRGVAEALKQRAESAR